MTTPTDASPLIDVPALRRLLGQPQLLVVDCRYDMGKPASGREAWSAGHIPGAVFASMDEDLAAPKRPDSGRHPLPSPAQFAATLASWGFTPRSQVVAYDQGSGFAAARLWWMLRARGHRQVQVLDGGWAAWLAAAAPVEVGARPAPASGGAGSVEARQFEHVVSTAEVASGLADAGITLFDARAADRFAGRNETVDPVAGHVPGALNMPFAGNLAADGHWLPAAALRARWQPLVDAAAGKPLVAMCGSGVTACHNLLALELAGYRDARLYVGSFSEWITDPARPVATGEHQVE
ncbi:MAG: sulfurtransferase [Steroidobacteraceae bacterium]